MWLWLQTTTLLGLNRKWGTLDFYQPRFPVIFKTVFSPQILFIQNQFFSFKCDFLISMVDVNSTTPFLYLSLAVKESFFWTIIRSTYHQQQAIGEPLKGYVTRSGSCFLRKNYNPRISLMSSFSGWQWLVPTYLYSSHFRRTKDGKRDVKTTTKSSQKPLYQQ